MPKKDPKRKKNTGKTPQQSHIPRRYYFLFWLGVNRIPVENSNWTFFSTTEYRTTKMKRAKTHSCCGCTSVEKGKKRKGKGEQMWGPKKWKKLSWVMRPLPPPPSAIEPKWRPPRGTNHLGPSLPPTPIFQVKAFWSLGIKTSALCRPIRGKISFCLL